MTARDRAHALCIAEPGKLRCQADRTGEHSPYCARIAGAIEASVAAALTKYGTHEFSCGYRFGHDCDCGLEQLRAKGGG